MKKLLLIIGLAFAANASATVYDCYSVSPSMPHYVAHHLLSIETHQGLSELAYKPIDSGNDKWSIIATYDANKPKPGDDAYTMTFTHNAYKGMPVTVLLSNQGLQAKSVMFSDLCRVKE